MSKQTLYISTASVFMLGVIASCIAGDFYAVCITLTGVLGCLIMSWMDN